MKEVKQAELGKEREKRGQEGRSEPGRKRGREI